MSKISESPETEPATQTAAMAVATNLVSHLFVAGWGRLLT